MKVLVTFHLREPGAAAAAGGIGVDSPRRYRETPPPARDLLDIALRGGRAVAAARCTRAAGRVRALGDRDAARPGDGGLLQAPAASTATGRIRTAPKTSIRNIGSTSANSTAVAPSLRRRQLRPRFFAGHCVSISALRLIVPLGTKPKPENIGEKLRLAVIVTNWPPMPPPAQAPPQVTALPRSNFPVAGRAVAAGAVVGVVDVDRAGRPARAVGVADDVRDIVVEAARICRDQCRAVCGVFGAGADRTSSSDCVNSSSPMSTVAATIIRNTMPESRTRSPRPPLSSRAANSRAAGRISAAKSHSQYPPLRFGQAHCTTVTALPRLLPPNPAQLEAAAEPPARATCEPISSRHPARSR